MIISSPASYVLEKTKHSDSRFFPNLCEVEVGLLISLSYTRCINITLSLHGRLSNTSLPKPCNTITNCAPGLSLNKNSFPKSTSAYST
jgi:hypothetical protein